MIRSTGGGGVSSGGFCPIVLGRGFCPRDYILNLSQAQRSSIFVTAKQTTALWVVYCLLENCTQLFKVMHKGIIHVRDLGLEVSALGLGQCCP